MKILSSIFLLIKSRKEIIFVTTLLSVVGAIIAKRGIPDLRDFGFAILVMFFLTISVYIYNDLIDREMDAHSDKEKKKSRPIAHNQVDENFVKVFVIVTAFVGFILAYFANITTLIISVLYFIPLFLYSFPKVRFKKMFIMKNIVTALVPIASVLISGAVVNGYLSPLIIFVSGFVYSFVFLMLPAVADCLDYQEDKDFGIKTIGNTLSWQQNVNLFNLGAISVSLSGVILLKFFNFGFLPIFLILAASSVLMIYAQTLAMDKDYESSYKLRPVAYAYLIVIMLLLVWGVM